jgi:hypothetical protein
VAAPICFTCSRLIAASPAWLAAEAINLDNWASFSGYGPLPGVARAEWAERTDGLTGSRIEVQNTDGSRHVETIAGWEPDRSLRLELHDFQPPLARLATHFDEAWEFQPRGESTLVTRSFALHPASALTRPALWGISLLFRRAVDAQFASLQAAAAAS